MPTLQPHPGVQGYPGQPQGYPGQPQGYPPQPYGQGQPPYPVSPGGLYQFSPYGQPPPQPVSLTGALRLSEIDEIPAHYKINSARRRWLAYIVAGLIAVSVAAGTTFAIIRATGERAPTTGSLYIESVPDKAEVFVDGNKIDKLTPVTINDVPIGSRYEIRVEIARHQPFRDTVEIPPGGGQVTVTALLKPVTGKIIVNSQPGEAEIWINGQLRGRTPTTLNDVDMGGATKLELRLKGYQPFVKDLSWPENGQISLDVKLQR
jgi:hypothetical protein